MASPSLLAGDIEAELADARAAYAQKDAARLTECLDRLCIFVPLWRAYPPSEQAVWPAAEAQLVGLHQLIITSKVADRYPLLVRYLLMTSFLILGWVINPFFFTKLHPREKERDERHRRAQEMAPSASKLLPLSPAIFGTELFASVPGSASSSSLMLPPSSVATPATPAIELGEHTAALRQAARDLRVPPPTARKKPVSPSIEYLGAPPPSLSRTSSRSRPSSPPKRDPPVPVKPLPTRRSTRHLHKPPAGPGGANADSDEESDDEDAEPAPPGSASIVCTFTNILLFAHLIACLSPAAHPTFSGGVRPSPLSRHAA